VWSVADQELVAAAMAGSYFIAGHVLSSRVRRSLRRFEVDQRHE
jgi:hypothetical protein